MNGVFSVTVVINTVQDLEECKQDCLCDNVTNSFITMTGNPEKIHLKDTCEHLEPVR